jgi:hypothetical protein
MMMMMMMTTITIRMAFAMYPCPLEQFKTRLSLQPLVLTFFGSPGLGKSVRI